MLNSIQTEFMKLHRKKTIWMMLLSAFVMPLLAIVYFKYFGKPGMTAVDFYKWSAFGFTLFIILPFVLGLLSTMLMHDENKNDMLKQLWIVPVNKMGYFFSKFFIVLFYSICFMLLTAMASVLCGTISGFVIFKWSDVLFLLQKSLEIAVLCAFAMLPILTIATSQKGYIFPVCFTLVYVFAGFLIMSFSVYIHPLSCISVIISRNGDIPGLAVEQLNVPAAIVSFLIWDILAIVIANITLKKGK